MQPFETKMVGDEAKFVCDKWEFMANTNKAVKTHWNKKHRKEAQEEEEAKTRGNELKQIEVKKLKTDLNKSKKTGETCSMMRAILWRSPSLK